MINIEIVILKLNSLRDNIKRFSIWCCNLTGGVRLVEAVLVAFYMTEYQGLWIRGGDKD